MFARSSKGALSFGKTINGIANAFAKVKAKVESTFNDVVSLFSGMNMVRAIA